MSGLKDLSSDQLLARLLELVHRDRELEAELIEHLAEVDARRLYLREGCSSMFAYCVQVLRFAEAVAYKRIAAMRAARRHPELLTALRNGELHLTAVSLLAPQLAAENVSELLAAARHRTADEIRRMLADRRPKPDVASLLRRRPISSLRSAERVGRSATKVEIQQTALEKERGLPATPPDLSTRPSAPAPTQTTNVSAATASFSRSPEPLGGDRYLIRFTADGELHAQILELKALMRHQIPDGDVGKIVAKAVAVLLQQRRAQKFGECSTPRASRTARTASSSPSRQIPAAIRRAVSKRDGECCTFVAATGRRCGSRDFLEFHHRRPWARHRSHAVDEITLRCRAHNQYEAERDFGVKHMERFRKRDKPEITVLLPEAAALLPEAVASLPKAAALLPE
ncbi:MAG: HNH endonuclease, partial [Myxococcota bacterium]